MEACDFIIDNKKKDKEKKKMNVKIKRRSSKTCKKLELVCQGYPPQILLQISEHSQVIRDSGGKKSLPY